MSRRAKSVAFCAFLIFLFAARRPPRVDPRRYLIDGRLSDDTGYFVSDPILPAALKAGYRHTIVDRYWSTQPWDVEIDRRGWRNRDTASLPDAVMAGDSVVFGYGGPQDSAVVECLSRELRRPIYNAGIPGLDPAGYYDVLEHRYLPIAPGTRLIIVGFFGGNDLTDLEGTSWNELP